MWTGSTPAQNWEAVTSICTSRADELAEQIKDDRGIRPVQRHLPVANLMHSMDITALMERATTMLKVPAGEFQRNIGRYQDMALTQPVAVTRNGRERTVLISADEYQRLKRRDRQVLTLSDFTEADIAALEATRAPESSKAFDHELQQ